MPVLHRRTLAAAVTGATLLLTAAACSAAEDDTESTPNTTVETTAEAEPTTIEVEDNHGVQTISLPPTSVVATDNRTFQTLADWGIELSAAAVALMEPGLSYTEDDSIVDLGNHNEPNLEAIVAVEPDLIINGQRFASYYADIAALAPNAAIVELDPRDGEPFDEELRRQVEVLGQIFDRESDADALIAEFDESIARVQAAYDADQTVMAVITSGGSINYAAPTTGRTLGPVFDILGLTPALEEDGSTDHQGDDISVEAIAASNPDWILVMDRDAGVSASGDGEYTPANELITGSAALTSVTAVVEEQVVYMPGNSYLNEGIQTYTSFFNAIADAMEAS